MVGFPNNHGVFLLKMISTWGGDWGQTHHLRKHPYTDTHIYTQNSGTPKSSILIRFSIIFTIHFGGPPLFLETPIYTPYMKTVGWKPTNENIHWTPRLLKQPAASGGPDLRLPGSCDPRNWLMGTDDGGLGEWNFQDLHPGRLTWNI